MRYLTYSIGFETPNGCRYRVYPEAYITYAILLTGAYDEEGSESRNRFIIYGAHNSTVPVYQHNRPTHPIEFYFFI